MRKFFMYVPQRFPLYLSVATSDLVKFENPKMLQNFHVERDSMFN